MPSPTGKKAQSMANLHSAIDVGTNTIRMLVADLDGGAVRPVERMRRITSLGKELGASGRIGRKEFDDSISVLKKFRRRMDSIGVVKYRACGTAALRDAENREEFIEASAAGGVKIEVITAEEEARRTWDGIAGRIRWRKGSAVVMDIGGGSTEFIAGPGKGRSVSLKIGVVVSCDLLSLSDPPEKWELRNMRFYFSERIQAGTDSWGKRTFPMLIGTAGTFTTLAALEQRLKKYRPEKIDGFVMPVERLRYWEDRLGRLREYERLRLPGMEKGRERYIVPGVCQAVAAMDLFGSKKLVVSDAGLLEGILMGLSKGKGEKG